jgi:hypothetical protein
MFGFVEIGKEFHNNFRKERTDWKDLSDFQANAMKWVGDTIRQTKSQFFWSDGAYCWYTDATQTYRMGLWMTKNGILIFEDYEKEKLFRVQIL